MEKLIQEKRLRTVAIGTQWLHELRQAKVQALQVLWSSVSRFLVHVMAGGAADIADSCMARILVKNGHGARCFGADGAANVLRPGDNFRRVFGRIRLILVTTATEGVDGEVALALIAAPHHR